VRTLSGGVFSDPATRASARGRAAHRLPASQPDVPEHRRGGEDRGVMAVSGRWRRAGQTS
jgi:hypothetical protein